MAPGGAPDHAPTAATVNGTAYALTYDASGNMLTGVLGKVMTYDAENRPLSVRLGAETTCYVYGADSP